MKEISLEELQSKSDKMFGYLKKPMPSMDHPDEVITRLSYLGIMLAESGELKAAAQHKIDSVVYGEIGKALAGLVNEKLSATTINLYVKSAAKDYNQMAMSFDRINSAAGKQIMALQTLISYEKAKMNLI